MKILLKLNNYFNLPDSKRKKYFRRARKLIASKICCL